MATRRNKSPERDMQVSFFKEVAWRANTDWRWGMILSYPLQRGNDVVWLKMRLQEGASMKAGSKSKATESQLEWCIKLNEAGYLSCVLNATSAQDVVDVVETYFSTGTLPQGDGIIAVH